MPSQTFSFFLPVFHGSDLVKAITIPLFTGHDDWFAPTDIHENSMGSKAIAKEIWAVMQDNCIAQKAPNSCCQTTP